MFRAILFVSLLSFSLPVFAQRSSSSSWDDMARTDQALLPKYGNKPRNAEQKQKDDEFVATTLKRLEYEGNRQDASADWIKAGFNALGKKDPKSAMYEFNKAWLLDSTNNDVYWGFGAVYMSIGNYEKAREQYLYGLKKNPKHAAMLADYSSYFMAQFYGLQSMDPQGALSNLDSALRYLNTSYQLNPKEATTCFKLSAAYMLKNKCGDAWRYFKECEALGGAGITEDFRAELEGRCPQK
jgi:tetratricopeptide (TPR) repeat protein